MLERIRINSRFMSNAIHGLIDRLLPSTCILCGSHAGRSHNFCDDCKQDLPILTKICKQCALALPHENGEEKNNLICGACLKDPPPFNVTHALFPYEPPIIKLVTQLKFQHQLSHAKALGEAFILAVKERWYREKPLPQLIMPVPLHPLRLRERGFNQALEIARPVAKALCLPIDYRGIKRIKHTLAQSRLPAKARRENIADAFLVLQDYTNLSIAILDDVMTTGSTITELARALKQNGAKQIDIWCCARRDIAEKAKTR